MIDIKNTEYIKLLSAKFFFDENVFEILDPIMLKSWAEKEGVFNDNELSRTLLFKLDGKLAKGKSGSSSISKKLASFTEQKNLTTVRFMEDENQEIDNQNYIEVYLDQWDSGFKSLVHVLVSDTGRSENIGRFFEQFVKKYNPQYAFSNLYIVDHFERDFDEPEIDRINENYPIDSMNINRYQGMAKEGCIKDIQWLNYFNDRYLSNISLPNEDYACRSVKLEYGRLLQLSDSPFFSESDLEWVKGFREVNKEFVILK